MSSKTDISKICRTCTQNSTKLKSIWECLEEATIASVVTDCTGVEIVEDNELPNQICQKCLKELSNYVQFSKKTREADKQLRHMFKMKEEIETKESEKVPEEKVDDSIEMETNEDENNDSERDYQSDFEDEFEDPDYVMETKKAPKSNLLKATRKLKPKANAMKSKTRSKSVTKKAADESQDEVAELKTSTKTFADKVFRAPDELEQKTFDTVQLTPGQSVCCSCFQEFSSLTDLEEHVKTAHKKNLLAKSSEERHTCEICFRGYSSQQALNTHNIRTQQMTSVFECKICKFRCVYPSRRMAHAKAHDKPDKLTEAHGFICCAKMCNASFPTEELLLQHAPVAHKVDKIQAELAFYNKTRPVQCNICYGHFPSEKHVKGHRYRKYLPKRHQCSTCGESFYTKRMLELHEGTHLNEKNVVCEICSRRFYTRVELQQHLSYHAAKPRFVCDLCGKIFDKSSRLQAHVLAHQGKLPYVCEICNKAFAYKTRLTYHMRTHTGKPFQCRFCDVRFTLKCRARTHEMKNHMTEKMTDDAR